jgi:hypothetical protein
MVDYRSHIVASIIDEKKRFTRKTKIVTPPPSGATTFSITTFSVTTLSLMTFSVTINTMSQSALGKSVAMMSATNN